MFLQSFRTAVKVVPAMIIVILNMPSCGSDTARELQSPFDECRPYVEGEECDFEGELVCAMSGNGYYSCYNALALDVECGDKAPADARCGEGLECLWLERFEESRCVWSEEMGACSQPWQCAPWLICSEYGPEGKYCLLAECTTSAQCPPCQACASGVCSLDFDCHGDPDCHE